jgi:hypothetical protein
VKNGRHLLVDAATALIQAVMVEDGAVVGSQMAIGRASDLIADLVLRLFGGNRGGFADLDGLICCSGPGSVLGLRSVLVAMETWKIFMDHETVPMEYDSLTMGLRLNGTASGICVDDFGESLILLERNGNRIGIPRRQGCVLPPGTVFLNTRNPAAPASVNTAKYVIAEADFDILSICRPATRGELLGCGRDYTSTNVPTVNLTQ